LNNFSTLTSIISALGTAPIHRLKRTWDQVPARTQTTLEQMRKLMGSTKNFGDYRESLKLANPPCIPFFGKFVQWFNYGLRTYITRCLFNRSYLYWGWNTLYYQEIYTNKLCQTSKDGRSNPGCSAISKCSISLTSGTWFARIYPEQHASSRWCAWDVWEEFDGRTKRTRGRENCEVCKLIRRHHFRGLFERFNDNRDEQWLNLWNIEYWLNQAFSEYTIHHHIDVLATWFTYQIERRQRYPWLRRRFGSQSHFPACEQTIDWAGQPTKQPASSFGKNLDSNRPNISMPSTPNIPKQIS